MKEQSRRSQRVADLVRAEISSLLLLEAHDPDVKTRHDHGRRGVSGPADGARLLHGARRRSGARARRRRDSPEPRGTSGARWDGAAPSDTRRSSSSNRTFRTNAARASRSCSRRFCPIPRRPRNREIDGPLPPRLPLSARQARRPHVARRRRTGSQGADASPRRPQRDARPHGHGPAAPLRRRGRAAPGFLHAHGQVLRGLHPARSRDDDVRSRGRGGRPGPRLRRSPPGADRGAAAESFRGEFLQSPPAYSAKKVGGRKFYEMARKGESVPLMPKKVRVKDLRVRRDWRRDDSPSRSPAPPGRTSGRSRTSWARCSDAERTWSRSAGCGSATSTSPTPSPSSASRRCRRPTGWARPMRSRSRGSNFPFERVRLASLETWKIRKGQSIPARGVASKAGGLGRAGGTLRRDGGARPGEPDRHAGNCAHPAEAGLADRWIRGWTAAGAGPCTRPRDCLC